MLFYCYYYQNKYSAEIIEASEHIMTRDVCRTFRDLRCTELCVQKELEDLKKIFDFLIKNLRNVRPKVNQKIETAKYKVHKIRKFAIQEFCDNVNKMHKGSLLDCDEYTKILGKHDDNIKMDLIDDEDK